MRLVLVSAIATAALAPAGAFAVDYLSAEQAAKLMFPEAERFEAREIRLDAPQMQQLDAQGVRARSARWAVRVAQRAGQPLGYVVSDEVIGKFELISYAVGIGLDGAVKQVEILSYRESHGGEVRLPAWRRQFVGKTVGLAAARRRRHRQHQRRDAQLHAPHRRRAAHRRGRRDWRRTAALGCANGGHDQHGSGTQRRAARAAAARHAGRDRRARPGR